MRSSNYGNWGRREGGYRRQRGFHDNFASCVQTRRNTSRTRITQYLIRFEDKIHISRYTEQTKIEISGEMVREQIVSACNDSEYFVLIGDEATDVQHMNKPS